MIKDISKIFFTSFTGKIFGFAKIVILINFFGTNSFTDALILVTSIFWFWSNLVVKSLSTASIVPKFGNATKPNQVLLASDTIKSLNILSVLLLLLIFLYPEAIFKVFVPFASSEFLDYSTYLIKIMAPIVFFIAVTETFTLVNQYNSRMYVGSSNTIIINLAQASAILFTVIHSPQPHVALQIYGFATLVAYIITSLIQISFASGLRMIILKNIFSFDFRRTKYLVNNYYFFLLSALLAQINIYVDMAFISSLDSGSISKYNIIIKLPELGQSLLVGSMGIVFLNRIVKESKKISFIFFRMLLILMLLFIPALLGVYFFGTDILYFIYGKESFEGMSQAEILNILLVISVNVLIAVLVALFIKISIAKGKSKFLFFATLICAAINMIGNYLFIDDYGLLGVSIATLIASSALLVLFIIKNFFYKKNDEYIAA